MWPCPQWLGLFRRLFRHYHWFSVSQWYQKLTQVNPAGPGTNRGCRTLARQSPCRRSWVGSVFVEDWVGFPCAADTSKTLRERILQRNWIFIIDLTFFISQGFKWKFRRIAKIYSKKLKAPIAGAHIIQNGFRVGVMGSGEKGSGTGAFFVFLGSIE